MELWLDSPLLNENHLEALRNALAQHLGQSLQITLEKRSLSPAQKRFTPQAQQQQQQQERQQAALAVLESDPFVQALQRTFGARLLPSSIQRGTA